MHNQWLLYLQDPVVDCLGSFLPGLAKYTMHNHCLINLSATRVTNLFLLCIYVFATPVAFTSQALAY